MKNTEIKSLDMDGLQERIISEVATLQKLRFAHAVTPLENSSRIYVSRKTIARLKTELRARQIANAN